MVIFLPQENANKALELLGKFGNPSIIGVVKSGPPKVYIESIMGVERILEHPRGELLPRIC